MSANIKKAVRYILCTEEGKEIALEYDKVTDFKNGFARVELNGKSGYINEIGEEIIPPKYDKVSDFKKGFARVELNDKYGFINKTGKEVVPIIFD